MSAQPPIRVKTYRGTDAAATGRAFEVDAVEAAKAGFLPASQTWEGPALTVVYQRQAPAVSETEREARIRDEAMILAKASARRAASTLPASSRDLRIPPVAAIVGGGMVAGGSFLPWATASTGFASASFSGVQGDGVISAVMGGIIVLAGIAALGRKSPIAGVAALAAGLGAGWVAWSTFARIQRAIAESDLGLAQVGIGLYVVLAGAVVTVLAGIGMFLERTPTPTLTQARQQGFGSVCEGCGSSIRTEMFPLCMVCRQDRGLPLEGPV